MRQTAVRGIDDRLDRLAQQNCPVPPGRRAAGRAPGLLLLARGFLLAWDFRAGAARLRQADRDRLLAAFDLLARAPALQLAALSLVHRPLDLLLRLLAVPGHRSSIYSTLALGLSPRTSPSTFAWTSCCWILGFTSASAGNFTGRTSSSWMT